MAKIPKNRFDHWGLEFIWKLGFGYWNLILKGGTYGKV
jgi:hypothetical protein